VPTPLPAPSPGSCDYPFPDSPVSISTLAELEEGMVGTWVGCVTTPWTAPYWVTITFRWDGTYSARADENRDALASSAFYYGTDADSPLKVYELNDLQDDLEGVGQIDIVFDVGTVTRDDLRNIRLMGDQLEFEFFHLGFYGPLTYQLWRTGD
jgi:hypothetical protein